MSTKPYNTTFHVFTDKLDEWLDDYDTARGIFDEWAKEFGSARLYENVYWTEDEFNNGDGDEQCLLAVGEYPC